MLLRKLLDDKFHKETSRLHYWNREQPNCASSEFCFRS
jgi:hypothetical protein